MGKSDIAVRQWLSANERFADLFNGTVFHGDQIVLPEELEMINGEAEIILTDKDNGKKGVQKYRDIAMRWKKGAELAVLACENQDKIHYAMPVRTMLYDSLSYAEQIRTQWKSYLYEQKKMTGEEYLSRFRKTDKIYPVITLVFYYGQKEWDGSIDLFGMLQMDQPELKKYVPNYRINLLDAGNVEDVKQFQTDLQVIFGMLKLRKQKEKLQGYIQGNKEYFGNLDMETYQVLRVFLNSEKQLKEFDRCRDGGGQIDMCKALEDLYEEGREKGIEEVVQLAIETCGELGLSKEDTISRLKQKLKLSGKAAESYLDKYW